MDSPYYQPEPWPPISRFSLPPPPAPPATWKSIRPYLRKRYYFSAVGMIFLVLFTSGVLQIIFPPLRYTLLSMVLDVGSKFLGREGGGGGGEDPQFARAFFSIALFYALIWFLPRIPRFAEQEENEFRKHSQHWYWYERIQRTLVFGLLHFFNLIIPVSLAIALALPGFWFMSVYLKAWRQKQSTEYAVKSATAAHSAYNLMAVLFIGLVGIPSIWFYGF